MKNETSLIILDNTHLKNGEKIWLIRWLRLKISFHLQSKKICLFRINFRNLLIHLFLFLQKERERKKKQETLPITDHDRVLSLLATFFFVSPISLSYFFFCKPPPKVPALSSRFQNFLMFTCPQQLPPNILTK